MLITNRSQLYIGQVVYRASAVKGYTVVECLKLQSDPYILVGSYFVDAEPHDNVPGVNRFIYSPTANLWNPSPYQNVSHVRFSTCDAGIDQVPRYNNHGLYDSLHEAMHHVEKVCNGTLVLHPPTSPGPTPDPTEEASPIPAPESADDAYERAMKGI